VCAVLPLRDPRVRTMVPGMDAHTPPASPLLPRGGRGRDLFYWLVAVGVLTALTHYLPDVARWAFLLLPLFLAAVALGGPLGLSA
jgi:hypothetical protein